MSFVIRKPTDAGVVAEPPRGERGGMPPIDLVHLARQSLGDRGLELELLSLFDRQAGQILSQIESASTAGDSRFRRDLAHTLKGSARAVGAGEVATAAHDFEAALMAGQAAPDLSGLGAAVARARVAITELLADR